MTRARSLAALGLLALIAVAPRPACAQQPTPAAEPSRPADDPKSYGYLRDYGLELDFHNIGAVVPKGRGISTHRMYPAGFRADTYQGFSGNYGLGAGWQVGAGGNLAERLGPGGLALFYGLGVQKQFVYEKGSLPSVSIGAYGMFGPHNHKSQSVFLAATKRVLGGAARDYALFLHAGGKYDRYDSDDYGSSSGVRPYVGTTLALKKRFFINAEYSPSQPWDRRDMFSVQGTYRVWKYVSVGGGIRNNGYRTLPFFSIGF